MTIDEALYLTFTVDRSDGTTVYVHAAPLSRDAFNRYWDPLSRVYDNILADRRFYSAPKVAARILQKAAMDSGTWDGPQGVQNGLLPELRRLANVIVPGSPSGWQMLPFADATRDKLIEDDDVEAIENLLVFFTAIWRTEAKRSREGFVTTGAALCGAQTSSLSLSEYADSLPTSTAPANTGETPPAPSSPPSSTGQPAMASRPSSTIALQTFPGAPPQNIVIAS